MRPTIRFGDYLQEVGIRHEQVSYSDVVAASPAEERLELRSVEVVRILRPYVSPRFAEQFKAVVQLALYLVAFQLLFLRQPVEGSGAVAAALLGVIVGLMFFMEGLKLGLMPLGERMGETLPSHEPREARYGRFCVKRANREELARFLASSRVAVMQVDHETADRYGEIFAYLRASGTRIPTNDIWIAATAMQWGLRMHTTDPHFQRVPQILVELHPV